MTAKLKVVNAKFTLIALILGVVLTVLTPFSVYGASNPYILLDSDKGVDSVVEDANSHSQELEFKFDILIQDKKEPKKVEINKIEYLKLTAMDKKDLMESTLTAIEKSSMGGRDRSRLYNFIEEQDEGTASAVRTLSTNVSTDFVSANSLVRPFTGPISTFLGLACIIVFFMLAISITVDICFLTIPMFQAFVMRNDKARPSYISQEAWDALLISESNLGNGKHNLWGVYFKNRMRTMLIIGITLGYLIAGQVFDLVIFIVDFFQNIFS
ncbi:hypothetical protein COF68_05875 [Bacillus toyonensis]|uniref:hypothetical protein n=1 Tax=Bacillus toyonensis TaxID=155322 RepID=UPI000BFBADB3|nr:hypothetical protein [Bacillus toyonensis]PHE64366.1 hypothetical protein COF68_05875 [Bacillus toyonensis]